MPREARITRPPGRRPSRTRCDTRAWLSRRVWNATVACRVAQKANQRSPSSFDHSVQVPLAAFEREVGRITLRQTDAPAVVADHPRAQC